MKHQPRHPLPFVQDTEKKRVYWHVKPTGHYDTDCKTGQQYALQLLAYMQREGFPPLLAWVAKDMPRPFTGIEIAFLETVAKHTREVSPWR